jgi:hypothetical protein
LNIQGVFRMKTPLSDRALPRPSLSSLFRFLAEWARPQAPVVRPRFRPYLEILEARTVPALLHVTSLADDGAAGTLRSIISTANTNADGSNTIVFDVTGTIDLTAAPLNPSTGIFPGPTAFDVNKPLTILGGGQTITRDAAAPNFRFFFVEATGNLSLSNLTLTNGLAKGFDGAGGGGGSAGLGGAIYNRGALGVQGVTFFADSAVGGNGGPGGAAGSGGGAGLGGPGSATAGGGPSGGGFGGGAAGSNGFSGEAGFQPSGPGGAGGFGGGGGTGGFGFVVIGGNGGAGGFGGGGGGGGGIFGAEGGIGGSGAAGGFGGGSGSSGNGGGNGSGGGGAGLGGAIFSEMGPVTITNSTLFGNSVTGGDGGGTVGAVGIGGFGGSGFGGAVFAVDGALTITNTTLSDNTVKDGANKNLAPGAFIIARGRDVYIAANSATATAIINNSILGQTDQTQSFFSDFSSDGSVKTSSSGSNNLISNPGSNADAFGGSSSNADPMLDPAGLKYNGGLTPTIALLPGSPAIDAGNDSIVPAGVTTDQRGPGFARISGSHVDIGAYEVQPPPPPSVSVAFGPNGAVVELVNSAGVLTQFDAAGAHVLGGGVRYASIAFGPNGYVLEVVSTAGILTQFDASGAHQLGGAGVESASVAFGPGGEVLEVVLIDGSLRQFSAAGVQVLATSGVVSASVAFGPSGEVVELLSTAGALTQFDATGAHQLGGAGVRSAGVAFTANSLVLDIIFSDGTLDQFDAFGVHRLGLVS